MNDRKDDGTTLGGIGIAIACLICFAAGYWVRDLGFRFYVQQSPPVERSRDQAR